MAVIVAGGAPIVVQSIKQMVTNYSERRFGSHGHKAAKSFVTTGP
jgi:hypothetical protein